jgi:hypothetical protein
LRDVRAKRELGGLLGGSETSAECFCSFLLYFSRLDNGGMYLTRGKIAYPGNMQNKGNVITNE